jgi:hypothetical protein
MRYVALVVLLAGCASQPKPATNEPTPEVRKMMEEDAVTEAEIRENRLPEPRNPKLPASVRARERDWQYWYDRYRDWGYLPDEAEYKANQMTYHGP